MEESFDNIVSSYQDKVYRLDLAMLGDPALAEDAAQESFLRIWKGMKGFRGQSALSTWIYAVTRNVCRDALARRPRPVPVPEESFATPAPARATIDLEALLAAIPERYAQVVRLFYLEENSYEEVSTMLDLPLGTVKTFLHRARKQLLALAASVPVEEC
jgi:RNA polymerase sigma-70 factor (ECF subfamily)